MANDAKFSWAMNNSYKIQEYQVEESSSLNSDYESWLLLLFFKSLNKQLNFSEYFGVLKFSLSNSPR